MYQLCLVRDQELLFESSTIHKNDSSFYFRLCISKLGIKNAPQTIAVQIINTLESKEKYATNLFNIIGIICKMRAYMIKPHGFPIKRLLAAYLA